MLARFYGFSHEEIERMPFSVMQDYLLAIESLRAQEFISSLNAETYPWMKESDRKRLFTHVKRSVDRVIDKGYHEERKSVEDLAKILMRGFSVGD